jgi:hypothetical protein
VGDWAQLDFVVKTVDTHNAHDGDFFHAPYNGVYGFIFEADFRMDSERPGLY